MRLTGGGLRSRRDRLARGRLLRRLLLSLLLLFVQCSRGLIFPFANAHEPAHTSHERIGPAQSLRRRVQQAHSARRSCCHTAAATAAADATGRMRAARSLQRRVCISRVQLRGWRRRQQRVTARAQHGDWPI